MKVFSLFSGIGGFDLACQRHGHRIIGACEIDRYARAVYAGHFTEVPIHKDATKIRPEELPDFDILCAGFPCQAFSTAGKRLGFEESRGTLFFEIVRIAKEKRPRFLLLENVGGLLSHDRGKTFAVILAALDEIGYDAQWQVLNSKYFIPQSRERIFIIANLREMPRPEVFPIYENNSISNSKNRRQQEKRKWIRSFISTIDSGYGKFRNCGETYVIMTSNVNANVNERLQKRETTWTLTTRKDEFALIDNQTVRRLTPLECERLQGFPDRWTESGIGMENTVTISDRQRYRCLGNAVTVPVVEYIMKKLMEFEK